MPEQVRHVVVGFAKVLLSQENTTPIVSPAPRTDTPRVPAKAGTQAHKRRDRNPELLQPQETTAPIVSPSPRTDPPRVPAIASARASMPRMREDRPGDDPTSRSQDHERSARNPGLLLPQENTT